MYLSSLTRLPEETKAKNTTMDKKEKNLEAVRRFREKERMEKAEMEERQRKIKEKEVENEKKKREIERLKKELESTRTLYRVMNKHNPRFGQDPSVKKFLKIIPSQMEVAPLHCTVDITKKIKLFKNTKEG